MPRVSKEATRQNHEAIKAAAARLFRERGLPEVSVSDVMAAAGLTHGGFYGHFASKGELAAAACATAFARRPERWRELALGQADPLGAVLAHYLSTASRDAPGEACAAPSLAADVARAPADAPVRQAFLDGVVGMRDALAELLAPDDPASAQEAALAQLALMVGAMALARATSGTPLSDEILAAARTHRF